MDSSLLTREGGLIEVCPKRRPRAVEARGVGEPLGFGLPPHRGSHVVGGSSGGLLACGQYAEAEARMSNLRHL